MRLRSYRRTPQRFLLGTILAGLALLVILLCARWAGQWLVQRDIKITSPAGIDREMTVSINGHPMWFSLRGEDMGKPLLLMVHGGPGIPLALSATLPYSRLLEKDFVVVHWDQRQAGNSFQVSGSDKAISIEQQVADLDSVTQMLLSTFGRRKLYIMGHSWGSVASLLGAQRFPQRIAAYISTCQVVNMERNEELSHRFLVETAKQRGDTWISNRLAELGAPPYGFNLSTAMQQKAMLFHYRGLLWQPTAGLERVAVAFWSPFYDLLGLFNVARGSLQTIQALMPEFISVKFDRTVRELKVPVAFVLGRHDYMTPSALAAELYAKVKAPHKEIHWFEEAAHFPYYADPERFATIVRSMAQRFQP